MGFAHAACLFRGALSGSKCGESYKFSRLFHDVTKGRRLTSQEFIARIERGWDVLSNNGKFGTVIDPSESMRSSLLPPKDSDPHHRHVLSAWAWHQQNRIATASHIQARGVNGLGKNRA